MSYQDELKRLQKIITADDSNNEQRNTARAARDMLINNSIEEAFKRFENRTSQFNQLIGRLGGVIDRISANQLTGVIETLNTVLGDVQKAAEGN